MGRISDTVKHIIIINFIVYIGSQILFKGAAEDIMAIHFPFTEGFQFHQVLSHMFMHSTAGINHILFNMFGIYMFGSAIEYTIGRNKFLQLYFVSGLGAMILQMISWYVSFTYFDGTPLEHVGAVGASGALFGLLAAYAMYYPDNKIMLLFFPVPIKAKYFVLGYAAIELFSGLNGATDNVGHFAHVGGAIAGFLLVYFWQKSGQRY